MAIESPKENQVDKAVTFLKSCSELLIPGSSLLLDFIKSPYEKRVSDWQKEVSETLNKLEKSHDIALESLKNDEKFIDILIQAVQIGIRQHQREKRDALKNAIINSVSDVLDFDLKQIFLNYIDIFTVGHIQVLEILMFPYKIWKEKNPNLQDSDNPILSISLRENIIAFFSGLKELYVFDAILEDLQQKGLVEKDVLFLNGQPILLKDLQAYDYDKVNPFGPKKMITDFGKEFMKFIKEN